MLGPMDYRMAVRTDGPQIPDRVHLILATNLRERLQVVNMDESGPDFTVLSLEIEAAHGAARPIMGKAFISRSLVPLVGVNDNSPLRTFRERSRISDLVWVV